MGGGNHPADKQHRGVSVSVQSEVCRQPGARRRYLVRISGFTTSLSSSASKPHILAEKCISCLSPSCGRYYCPQLSLRLRSVPSTFKGVAVCVCSPCPRGDAAKFSLSSKPLRGVLIRARRCRHGDQRWKKGTWTCPLIRFKPVSKPAPPSPVR